MEVWWITGGILAAAVIALLIALWAWRYVKAGPNEVLIVAGGRGTIIDEQGNKRTVGYRMVRGGGTLVWPIKERVQRLSLELMTLDVRTPEAYTAQGVRLMVDGIAQIKIRSDDASIAIAAEQFLSRSRDDIMRVALQTLEGHMRAVLGTISVEDVYLRRDEIAQRIREAAARDLKRMGLEAISFIIRNLSDSEGYLDAVGRPRVAQVKRDAVIGEAEAEREAEIVRFAASTKIEAARRDHEIKRAEFEAGVLKQRAQADLAYDLQRFQTAQTVKREEVQVNIVEKEMLTALQEKEIRREENELMATVVKPAEAESRRIQTLADAEKYRLLTEAAGAAEATRAQGFAHAEVIRAEGAAEAETMSKKADSWSQYNEAAITEMFVNILPKLAEAVSQPLSKTERIVIIGGSNGASAGASRVTRDVTDIIAQLPPVIEALTGMKLQDLVGRIPGLRSRGAKEEREE